MRTLGGHWVGEIAVGTALAVALGGFGFGADETAPAPKEGAPAFSPEPPHWPIAFETPGVPAGKPDRTGRVAAPLLAWLPPGATHVRALFIIPNNSDSKHIGEHGPVRAVAAKRDMAIVYLRNGDVQHVEEILGVLAAKTRIPEIRHAPWIVQGKSSRGNFPFRMEWTYPKRTIAGVTYHGETPPWPPAATAQLGGETILHVNANGESEWGGTWFVHVRPALLNYRAQKNWLPHQVVAKDVGHGDYVDAAGSPGWGREFPGKVTCVRVWDYLALFIDKAIALRVPADKYAVDGPVELKQVDESAGYVIDPFAVEAMFQQPPYPLKSSPTGYVMGEADFSTFAAIRPAADLAAPEGAPVAPLTVGQSPSAWLVTETMKFTMKNDPMTDLGGLERLRPRPGDRVRIDDYEASFNPIAPKAVPAGGGIALGGGSYTLLGYTLLDVAEPMCVRLRAPFSVVGRLQVVLNGTPVEHRQVVELQKGLYPMLVVLRKSGAAGTNWGSITPMFETTTAEDVEQAKTRTVEKARRDAEQKKLRAAGFKTAAALIRKAADVPGDERKNMFWLADRELAEAWFKLHAIHNQTFDLP